MDEYLARSRVVTCVFPLLGCAIVLYAWCAYRVYGAHRLAENRDEASFRRAILLEPRDASNYDMLGQYFIWDAQDARAAAGQFRQAAALNPFDSAYWLHLAQAYNSLGADHQQAAAIRHAIVVDPTTPEIAWSAANFFLIQGDKPQALKTLAMVVRNDPAMAEAALSLSWRASGNVGEIERRLPSDPEIYLKLLKVLVAKNEWNPAAHTWSSLLALNREIDPHSALFYVDALLANRNVAGAQSAWAELVQRSRELHSYIQPDNLVVNPGFDREILNAGFDWHSAAVPNVSVMLDSTQSHQGSVSLLITYSGPSEDAGMCQYLPVTPGTTYMASAWVKSEELESANGPRLTISDPYKNLEYAHSDETVGTSSWHRVLTSFTAGPETNLILLRFTRKPGDTQIRGRFWVDGVRFSQNAVMNDEPG
ncbi:MAG: carbohydrate binding domain-containing protein [Acidobacteriaceae bacterium]|nr:carbohydrate binding domain-containing protein [Acidobacteriaceae bacterium]